MTDEELELAAAMGAIPYEQAALMRRGQRAQGLIGTPGAQGQQVGRVYRASSPLEHAAGALARAMGYREAGKIDQEFGGLAQRAQQAGLAQARQKALIRQEDITREQGNKDRDFGLRERGADLADMTAMSREADSATSYAKWEREQTERERSNLAREKLLASKPSGGGSGAFLPTEDLDAIAEAIARGDLPPALTPYRSNAAGIAARLARRGIDASELTLNFEAEKKAISSLNSTQQVRLRQTMTTLDHSLEKLEEVYARWQKVGPASGFRKFNKAALTAAQQVGGEAGATAQELVTLINDMVAETANVYMGGNSPTDHALKLAGENLKAEWNEATFTRLLELMRTQLKFRRQAMDEIRASGTRGENPYSVPDMPNLGVHPVPPPGPAGAGKSSGGASNDPLGIR
jgi:hypothetical protein